MKVLDCKIVSSLIKDYLKKKIKDNEVKLSVILASNDPASEIYVKNKIKSCLEVGIKSELITPSCEESIPSKIEGFIISKIEGLNNSDSHGILVQLPLPKEINQFKILDLINPLKDVDVLTPMNVGLLSQNRPRFYPCTPYGIHTILLLNNIFVSGKKITIINSSNIVGKPLNKLWIDKGATVTVCHDKTPPKLLKEMTLASDIVVVAVGIPGFLTPDMVNLNSVVIDVGINRLDNKIVGDVHKDVNAKAITKVPGGIGLLTVTMLLVNTYRAFQLSRGNDISYNDLEKEWIKDARNLLH